MSFPDQVDRQAVGRVAAVTRPRIVPAACIALTTACAAGPQEAQLVSYLGQRVPGVVPELFAPGVVSTGAVELNAVFAALRRTGSLRAEPLSLPCICPRETGT